MMDGWMDGWMDEEFFFFFFFFSLPLVNIINDGRFNGFSEGEQIHGGNRYVIFICFRVLCKMWSLPSSSTKAPVASTSI